MPDHPAEPAATDRAPAALPAARTAGARLLVVDDDPAVRRALERALRFHGYEVMTAAGGVEALAVVARERPALMLCDVRMPGMPGTDVVPQALAIDADLAVVMLTGVNDAPTAAVAMSRGALGYLTKPVDLPRLCAEVERALARGAELAEQRRLERRVREEVRLRTVELEREQAALRALTVGVAETLINAMEAKDVYLRGHSQRVAELATAVAGRLGLPDSQVEELRLAGRLHDVGKIGIREDVLNKPGRLTPEEFAHVQEHVRIGVDILRPLAHLGRVLDFVHDHHEQYAGEGYPRGLAGGAISIGGRVLAACDAFDALTSQRAYRDPLPMAETIEYLVDNAGRLHDPAVVAALRDALLASDAPAFVRELA